MKKGLLSLLFLGISVSFAQEIQSFGEAIRLGDNINTSSEEAKPVLNSDGTIMYFVRAFHSENVGYAEHQENEDIWEAIKDENGEWKLAEHEVSINDEKNNSIIGQGKEDHYFLLNTYQDKRHLDYGIAQARKLSEHNWTKPEVTKIPKLKYMGDFYDFYITHDEKILIISIQGEDTKGKEDLYVTKNIDGKWSEPINLGDVINTSGFEMSPFLTEDKKYLYFSTNGREDGFGDADVYVTERLDDTWTNWSTPKNLGNIVNSNKMDCYFTMADNGDFYFSSNREGSQGLDLYNLTLIPPMVVLTGKIFNSKDSSELATNLKLTSLSTNENVLASSEMSTYTSTVKIDGKFNLISEKENFTSVSLSINMADVKVGDTITTNIYMVPIEVVATVEPPLPPLVLKRILHPFDEDVFTSETKLNIDDVYEKMKSNEWMTIRIESYTDSKGTDSYNNNLSNKRAIMARDYLINKGIAKSKLTTKAFGNTNPLVPNVNKDGSDNEEGRAINRRTEFVITSKRPE